MNIGDYLIMGSYLGNPVLWRCVAFHKITDDNQIVYNGRKRLSNCHLYIEDSIKYDTGYAPLFLCDRILCIKPYDVGGENKSGSHGRDFEGEFRVEYGSPYWGDSNIRCWLNSDANKGGVNWLCGNPPDKVNTSSACTPYAEEAGFLSGFDKREISAIRTVKQDTLLRIREFDNMKPYYHEIECRPEKIYTRKDKEQMYAAAKAAIAAAKADEYEKTVIAASFDLSPFKDLDKLNSACLLKYHTESFSDKMFLLDKFQFKTVIDNETVLGKDYHRGKLNRFEDDIFAYYLDHHPNETVRDIWKYYIEHTDGRLSEDIYSFYLEHHPDTVTPMASIYKLDAIYRSNLYNEGYFDYWLRTPYERSMYFGSDDHLMNEKSNTTAFVDVMPRGGGGRIDGVGPRAYDVGVRPAFYLEDPDKLSFTGDGSITTPYRIE